MGYRRPFSANWRGDGQWGIMAEGLNRIEAFLNNLRGDGDVGVELKDDGAVIRCDTQQPETFAHSFKCTLGRRAPVAPETAPVLEVRIAAGYKQIIGTDPVSVAATEFDVGSGGSIYCTWTYTTDDTAGAWSDPFWAYGTPTTEDETVRVVVLATVTSAGVITHRHLGDVVVLDIVDRTACA